MKRSFILIKKNFRGANQGLITVNVDFLIEKP